MEHIREHFCLLKICVGLYIFAKTEIIFANICVKRARLKEFFSKMQCFDDYFGDEILRTLVKIDLFSRNTTIRQN
jgi:hypothetical protein